MSNTSPANRVRLFLRRVLAPLFYPRCAPGTVCRPSNHPEHSTHSIRSVCLLCGRRGPWIKVRGPF